MTQNQAMRVAAERGYTTRSTGLRKVCPRCKREGWTLGAVFPWGGDEEAMHFVTVWEPRGRRGSDIDVWALRHIVDPVNGCGHCPATRETGRYEPTKKA